ncbi:CCA tRNA nucleotidyltransferase, partial [archaeon]|nr:CCA tRNA nucleotidyltransferase [archaeon]
NALFYDISNFSIIDYVGGLKDMDDRRACIIGDPCVRFREDPVRVWRVIRHAARIGFSIENHTSEEINRNRDLIITASGARLFEELNKDLSSCYLYPVLDLLRQYEILPLLLGDAGKLLQEDSEPVRGILGLLHIVDTQADSGHGLSNEIVLSLLLWPWAQAVIREETREGGDIFAILHERLQTSGMTVTVPKSLKMNITQILAIVDRMFTAMDTGRMRWSLKKRSRYNDASLVFHLLHKGELSEARDPFGSIFQEKYPSSGTTPGKRRRYPRRRRRKPKPAPETA